MAPRTVVKAKVKRARPGHVLYNIAVHGFDGVFRGVGSTWIAVPDLNEVPHLFACVNVAKTLSRRKMRALEDEIARLARAARRAADRRAAARSTSRKRRS